MFGVFAGQCQLRRRIDFYRGFSWRGKDIYPTMHSALIGIQVLNEARLLVLSFCLIH